MVGLAIAGILSAIAAAYAAHKSSVTARRNTDMSNAANKQLADLQFTRDQEMVNQQNAYNSPEQQQLRLSKAGLNPNLVYGQGVSGATGAQTSLAHYNAPKQEYNYEPDLALPSVGMKLPDMIMQFQDLKMRQAQIDNVHAQTRLADANAGLAPFREELMKTQKNKTRYESGLRGIEFEVADRAHMGGDYQFEVMKERARSGYLLNQRMAQEMSARDQDIIFKRFQNQWMKEGVTGRDSIFTRMLIRQFPDLFSNMAGMFK